MFRKLVLPVALISLFSAFASGASISAQTQDQLIVIDGAGIFGDQFVDVEDAAGRLTSKGADVRVRTIVTYGPFGNLDQYESDLEQRSPSWLGADGYRKNNLIVLIICLQGGGQTGLYFGDYWSDVLDDEWHRVQADIMNPRFRDGDYAGGAVAGLDEIRRLIEDSGEPSADGASAGLSTGSALLIAMIAVVASVVGLFLYMNHRKAVERRAGLRQKALMAKQAAAAGVNELIETLRMLEIKLNVVDAKVAPEDLSSLHSGFVAARRLVDLASQRYSELSHSAADPENPALREAELAAIEPEFQGIVENLRHARESITTIEQQVMSMLELVDGFPGAAARIHASIGDAERLQQETGRAGFNIAYVADLLVQAQSTLALAQGLAVGKRIKEATEHVKRAALQVEHAVKATRELPQKRQEAEVAVPALATRIDKTRTMLEQGHSLFERLSQDYAETTWQPIRGNGTEAENRLRWAEEVLEEATTAVSMDLQEWYKALELVARGNGWLDEAVLLVKAISELETSLVAARRDAPPEIAAARADVQKAWDFIRKYDDDIRESLETDLQAAEATLNAANEELHLEKPDYLRVFKLARDANESADRVLIQAMGEREAAVLLRARAASALRDAQGKVSTVTRFIQVRHPFVRDAARNRLADAIEALRQAEVASEADVVLSLAQKSEAAADEAYSLAQRDVATGSGSALPGAGTTGGTVPSMNIPTILIPTGWSSGGSRPWGSRPSTSSRPSGGMRRGGGGSTGWGSRGGGGRSPGRGGGSTGW